MTVTVGWLRALGLDTGSPSGSPGSTTDDGSPGSTTDDGSPGSTTEVPVCQGGDRR